jgi:hypothetical protein
VAERNGFELSVRYLNWRATAFRRRLQHNEESSLVSIRRFGKSRNPGAQF